MAQSVAVVGFGANDGRRLQDSMLRKMLFASTALVGVRPPGQNAARRRVGVAKPALAIVSLIAAAPITWTVTVPLGFAAASFFVGGAAHAQSTGGTGGRGGNKNNSTGGVGGAGGTTGSLVGQVGGNGGGSVTNGSGGGGGGGAGGAAGGNGGDSNGGGIGGAGGIAGTASTAGGAGQAGTNASTSGGGGGGGGGGYVGGTGTLANTGIIAGTAGGAGGTGGSPTTNQTETTSGGGGGGGVGGVGFLINAANSTGTNSGSIAGGAGGIGGNSGNGNASGNGGIGGSGGIGVQVTATGVTLTNNAGATIGGGAAGAGGSSGYRGTGGAAGASGAGVQFTAAGTLNNSGTITGGIGALASSGSTAYGGGGNGAAASGGIGVNTASGSTVTNNASGTIRGGTGAAAVGNLAAGTGGTGVAATTINDSGLISGGAGGAGANGSVGGTGGSGAIVDGTTQSYNVTVPGLLTGGAGGAGGAGSQGVAGGTGGAGGQGLTFVSTARGGGVGFGPNTITGGTGGIGGIGGAGQSLSGTGLTISAVTTGAAGGTGGAGGAATSGETGPIGTGGAGGTGGTGGSGVELATGSTANVTASVTGGAGGSGGAGGGGGTAGAVGIGGTGGAGIALGTNGSVMVGANISGGVGGTGVTTGAGGVGITGNAISVDLTNAGTTFTVSGALSGGVRADSIDFTGGNSTLIYTTNSTSTLRGNIGVTGSLTINGGGSVLSSIHDYTTAGSITKTGAGNLSLNAASTYTGGTTISAGSIAAGDVAALGTGAVVDNATLLFQTSTGTITNAISGTGTLVARNAAAANTQTYSGALTGGLNLSAGDSNGGTIVLGNDGNTRTGTTSIGTNATLQGTVAALTSGAITDNGTLAYAGGTGTVASRITGSGAVTLSNNTALTLTSAAANSWAGLTTIGSGSSLTGTTGTIAGSSIANSGTLAYNQGFSGTAKAISGTGNVTVVGLGNANVLTFGAVNASGGVQINDASHVAFTGAVTGGVVSAASGSQIDVSSTGSITAPNSNSRAISTPGGTGTLKIVNQGTISSQTSDTFVNQGQITLINAGTAVVSSAVNVAASTGANSIVINGVGAQLNGGNSTTFGIGANVGAGGTVANFGTISGGATGGTNNGTLLGGTNSAATLYAGSTTGTITQGAGSTLTIYTGKGTGTGALTVDTVTNAIGANAIDATHLLVQNAGQVAAATFGSINLGGGGSTLLLRGTGTDAAGTANSANGVQGTLNVGTLTNATNLTKQDGGTWTLTGTGTGGIGTISAGVGGTPGAGGLLIFSGSGLTSAITVNGATIRATSAGAFGSGTITTVDPTIQYAATGTYANPIMLASAAPTTDPTVLQTFGTNITATLSGLISQPGATAQPLVFSSIDTTGVQNTGTFVLTNGGNNYAGLTTISGGTTVVDAGLANRQDNQFGLNTFAALGNGGVMINTGGTLQFDNQSGAQRYVKGDTFTGTGTIKFTGSTGSSTALGFGKNGAVYVALSQGGLIDVESGTTQGSTSSEGIWTNAAGTVVNKASLYIASGAIFDGVEGIIYVDGLTGSGMLLGGYGTSGSTTIGTGNSNATFTGIIADSTNPGSQLIMIKTGTGTQTLAGANSYTGATTISGGTLSLSGAGTIASSASITNNANFDISAVNNGGTIVNELTGIGTIALGANTLTAVNNGDGTISGVISGTNGGLTKDGGGNLTLTAANTYTGVTTVSAGTLTGTTTSIVGSSVIDNGTLALVQTVDGMFTRDVSGTGRITVSGLVDGTGASNGNTLTFTGALTQQGAPAVDGNGPLLILDSSNVTLAESSSLMPAAGDNNAVFLTAAGTFTNLGTVSVSSGAQAIYSSNNVTDGGVINNGSGTVTTASLQGGDRGILYAGGSASLAVNNYGLIQGGQSGIEYDNSGTLTLVNAATGVISATGGVGVYSNATGAITITNNAGGTIVAVGGDAVHDDGVGLVTIVNDGMLVGNASGLAVAGAVDITNTGLIGAGTLSGGTTGVFTANGQFVGVSSYGGTIRNNGGTIAGGGAAGIYSNAGLLTVTNMGTISTAGTSTVDGITSQGQLALTNTGVRDANGNLTGGIITAANASGVAFVGTGSSIVNSGSITGGNDATYGYGVQAAGGADGTITNQAGGTLSGGLGGIGRLGSGAVTIDNSGVISGTGTTSYGINVIDGTGTISNAVGGVIAGTTNGILSNVATTITNAGTIGTGTVDGNGNFAVGGAGLAVQIASGTVVNSGTLNSTGAAVYQTDANGTLTLVNSGSIGGAGRAIDPDDTVVASGTATIVNTGLITTPNYYGVVLGNGGTLTNGASTSGTTGTISAGGADDNRFAVIANGGPVAIDNYGILTSTNSSTQRGIAVGDGGATINLFAGSQTGAIQAGAGDDTLTLYTGAITTTADTVTDPTSTTSGQITVRAAGTYGAAILLSNVALGGGTNTLNLNGTGDGSAANGAAGTIDLSNVTGATTITKLNTGTWTLMGDPTNTGVTQINAGLGTAAGLLQFNGTANLTTAIAVNGATIQALSAGAFGTGTITAIDPTIQYSATGVYANDIVLAATDTANDPTNIRADNGVNATLSGTISEATGGQPLVINGSGSNGTITLTGNNTYTGLTTVASGTLAVNGANVSAATVSSGATLTGTGSVGATTIADGGTLSGTQGSTLTMASLGLTSGSIINATFGAPGGNALFAVTGNLTLDGTVNVADTGAFGFGVYRLINYGGTLTDNGLVVGTTPADAQRTLVQTSVVGQVNIVSSSSTLQFWDGGNTALYNNGTVDGGTGTWTATSPTFTDAGGLFNGAMTPQPGFAVFEANAGTVTVDNSAGAIAVTGMQFASSGYVVAGGAIGLADPSGTATIRVGDGTSAGAGYTATISSALTGANGLNKTDLGTLVLSGANTYTGTTTIDGGTLALSGGQAIADGNTVLVNANGTLMLNAGERIGSLTGTGTILLGANTLFLGTNDASSTFSGIASGTGGITQTGAGTLTLSGANTYTGTTLVSGGTFVFGASDVLADASTLNLQNATGTLGANSDTIATLFLSNSTLNGTTGTLTAQNYALSNATLNAQTGTGYLYTQGTNTNSVLNASSSATQVEASGGTLTLGASNLLADNAAVYVDRGSIVDLQGFSDTVGSLQVQGTLNGTGTLTATNYFLTAGIVNANLGIGSIFVSRDFFTGDSVSTLNGTAAATLVQVNANATLALGASDRLADNASVTVANGGTLDIGSFTDTVGTAALSGTLAGTGTLTASTYMLSGATVNANLGAGTLTQAGGTSTLNGTAGAATVTVNGGTLALGASDRLADNAALSVASGATLNMGAFTDTVGTAALSGTLNGTGTLTASTYTLSGAAVNANLGAGTLTQAGGTSTLNGTAGATTVNVNGGTLALGASNRLADTATVTIASGAALNMGAFTDTVGLARIAGTLSGTGTLSAAEYDLAGAVVNANLGTGNLFQQAGTSTLNGTAGAANVMVTGGTLVLGASNRLADNAAVGVATGATLNLGTFTDTVGTLALNGTLAGTGTLTASTYTLNGAAVNANLGTGTLVQAGGTSVLSGTAATNMVAVMAGTLRLGASDRIADAATLGVATGATFDLAGYNETVGTLAGGGTLSLGAGTLTAGGTNADYAFGGNVTGTGDLTKVGTGTFSLIGKETMTGRLNVNAGTVMLAGTTAGSVRIQGGTLTGASAIAGNLLLSSGTLSPGTSTQPVAAIQAGSLTVTGGTTVFDFGGMASGFTADLLKVTGAATLTGGTVTTRGLDPSAAYKMEQTYTIVQAGALTGTYANGATFAQVSNNADLYYRLRYDLVANGVVLEIRKPVDFTTTLGAGATGNQLSVAAALNGGVLTGSDSWAATLNAISQLSPDQRRATLDNIGGESTADISTSVALIGDRFNQLLRHRLAVGGAGNSADPSLIAGIAGGKRGLDQVRAGGQVGAEGSSFADGSTNNQAGAWVQTFGGAGRLTGSNGTATISDQSYGVAAGIDAKVAGLSIGGAFAASALDTRVEGRNATNRGTLYQGGGYVAYDSGTAYASAVGSYFSGDVDSSRQVYIGAAFQGNATGTSRVTGYTAGGAAGYRLPVGGGGVRFTPQVSVQATHVNRDAFTETGAGGLSLSVGKDVRNLYTATAEGRLSYLGAAPGGIIEPYAGAGVAFNFGDLDTLSANRFTGAPTGTGAFTVAGARLSPTTALINGGIEAHPNDRVTLGMGVETRLSNRERDGRLELHVRLGF